jgi:hypothetical protein
MAGLAVLLSRAEVSQAVTTDVLKQQHAFEPVCFGFHGSVSSVTQLSKKGCGKNGRIRKVCPVVAALAEALLDSPIAEGKVTLIVYPDMPVDTPAEGATQAGLGGIAFHSDYAVQDQKSAAGAINSRTGRLLLKLSEDRSTIYIYEHVPGSGAANAVAVTIDGVGYYQLNAFGRGSEGSYLRHGHGGFEPGMSMIVPTHLSGAELRAAVSEVCEAVLRRFDGVRGAALTGTPGHTHERNAGQCVEKASTMLPEADLLVAMRRVNADMANVDQCGVVCASKLPSMLLKVLPKSSADQRKRVPEPRNTGKNCPKTGVPRTECSCKTKGCGGSMCGKSGVRKARCKCGNEGCGRNMCEKSGALVQKAFCTCGNEGCGGSMCWKSGALVQKARCKCGNAGCGGTP